MRHVGILALALLAAALGRPAPAGAAPATKPYKPIEVTLAKPAADPGFDAVRKQLATIAQRKDRAGLARLAVAKEFFWERDFGGMFDAKKATIDNLVAALRLDGAAGWAALAAFAAEPSVGPIDEQPGAVCAPANPVYDDAELDAVLDDTKTDVQDWFYPRAEKLPARAAARPDAPVATTLGRHLVRVLGRETKPGGKPAEAWIRVATPDGRIAFVAPGSLASPLADRLCFAKDATGAWKIAGYVGGGD